MLPNIFGAPSGKMINYLFKLCAIVFVFNVSIGVDAVTYYGKSLGSLSQFHHGVKGDVYAVDSRTLFLKGFSYDGEGPAAYFYVGSSKSPSGSGYRLRDERGSTAVLRKYRNKDITLSLPEGKTLSNIKWFSVWCDEFSVNFGDVRIPKNLDFPKPQKIAGLSGIHGVSSDNIVIVDAQTLLVPNFSYDGEAPDAKFWVGRGAKPSPEGLRIPDENGKETPLRKYDGKTIVLTLPADLTVFDIGHFGVWCEAFTVDFAHVNIPPQVNVPPSLKMLGVSPQSKLNCEVLYDDLAFEVRWAVAGESIVVQLVAKLEDGEYMSFGISGESDRSSMVGGDVAVAWVDRASGKGFAQDYFLDAKSQCAGTRGSCPDERLGPSTNSIRLLNAAMVNGYSIVTYQRPLRPSDELDLQVLTNSSQPIIWAMGPLNQRNEVSYHSHFTKGNRFLDFGRQPVWNCPMPEMDDKMLSGFKDEPKPELSVKPLSNRNRQPSSQERTDQIPPENKRTENRRRGQNRFQNAQLVEQMPQSTERVSERSTQRNIERNSNRNVERNPAPVRRRPVPPPASAPKNGAWEIPPIQCYEPEDGVFYAQMGPTGGKQGYPAITGHVGWGISWYINGLLIPEINVVRGKTYTFVVEGGQDPEIPAKYHPFYITDDPIGGYEHKSSEEKANVKIFAGVQQSARGPNPIGVGRICNWTPDADGPPADEYPSFGAYQRSLTLVCDQGEPGVITWTPDKLTPDTVYYQCFTHRYLGWKINVLDRCDETPAASENVEVFVKPDDDVLEAMPSVRVSTRVKPNSNFVQENEKEETQNTEHERVNIKPVSEEVFESQIVNAHSNGAKPLELKQIELKTIHEGIKAAEELEASIIKYTQYNKKSPVTFPTTERIQTVDELLSLPIKTDALVPPFEYSSELQYVQNSNIPTFLRPPLSKPVFSSNFGNAVPRRPVNQNTGNRPRRPIIIKNTNTNQRQRPLSRPFPVPQSSVLVNYYKKPIYKFPLMRHPVNVYNRPQFVQNKNIFPGTVIGRPLNDVALLGEHSEIKEFLRNPGQIILEKPLDASLNPEFSEHHLMEAFPVYTSLPVQYLTTTFRPATPRIDFSDRIKTTSNKPSKQFESAPYQEPLPTMKPAVNTGFKPDSVVFEEGGFKPIVSEGTHAYVNKKSDVQVASDRRMDTLDNESQEIEYVDEANDESVNQRHTEYFGPMFIPSPPDSRKKTQELKKQNKFMNFRSQPKPDENKDHKEPEEGEDGDKMAMAAERVESYYLPPSESKESSRRVPSDISLLPGTVVTYDGKTVSDLTLASSIPSNDNTVNNRYILPGVSKTEQFIRGTPQFVPFRGEIPPPVPEVIQQPDSLPQLRLQGNSNSKLPVNTNSRTYNGENNKSAAISTHLTLVRQFEEDLSPEYLSEGSENHDTVSDDDANERVKRSAVAHHTPEHTAEMRAHEFDSNDHSNHTHSDSASSFIKSTETIIALCSVLIYFTL